MTSPTFDPAATPASSPSDVPAPSTAARPGRKTNIALWTFQILTAALMFNGAVIKYLASEETVEAFAKFGVGDWFLYFIATAELVGGIALLIPRLAGAAACAFALMMVGAAISEVLVLKSGMLAGPLVTLAVVSFIAWGRRDSTRDLVRQLSSPLRRA
ncbi:DoxX family protein [Streptomyces daliensis]|uniref:DoxX family protein n=1 Tax=Streptomyces daliensis TaxID=299421 RepID=A0A8T4IPG7_9ACTN|nr:DoxX family protein [Streptomyces daliensis]